MDFFKILRSFRWGIRFILFFLTVGLFLIFSGFIGGLFLFLDIAFICKYGTHWEEHWEQSFGVGSFINGQQIGLICGLSFLAIILLLVWGYKASFPNRQINRNSERRRKHRSR